jgi:hypothetical protein
MSYYSIQFLYFDRASLYIFFYQIHDFTNALKEYKYIIKLTIPLLPKLRDYFTEFTYIKKKNRNMKIKFIHEKKKT